MKTLLQFDDGHIAELPTVHIGRLVAPFVIVEALFLWLLFTLSSRVSYWPWDNFILFLEVFLTLGFVSTLVSIPIAILARKQSPQGAGGGEKK